MRMGLLSRSESFILVSGLLLLAGYADVRRRREALRRDGAEVLPGGRWYYSEASEATPAPLARLERHERRYIAERVALALSTWLWLLALIVVAARLVIARLSA